MSGREKVISAVGGLVAITAISLTTRQLVGAEHSPLVVASMGASAVLLFAVPHGQLSQPWPILAGHGVSAAIGVAVAQIVPSVALASGAAVGLAILMMHQFKFIHPPGGATAMTAVIGGPSVTSLGYGFVWRPVMVNALLIVAIAVVFNLPFRWRRYPTALARTHRPTREDPSHEVVVDALRRFDSFIDVSEDDLLELYRIVSAYQAKSSGGPAAELDEHRCDEFEIASVAERGSPAFLEEGSIDRPGEREPGLTSRFEAGD